MLDHLSRGRVDFGFGRGISPIELGFYGLNQEEAGERFAESREIILRALTSDRLTYHGTHYSFDDVPMVMRPLQSPHPPLWYGVSKASSCAWAAANDVNIVSSARAPSVRAIMDAYRAEWGKLGKPGEELPLLGANRHIVVADSEREAIAIAERCYPEWLDSLLLLWQERGITPPHIEYPPSAEQAIAAGFLFAGTVATVTDAVRELVGLTGINYLLGRFAFGSMPISASLRSVELMIDEVIPALAGEAVEA
jgi:alkanesulfonate monooxygenase SsuD/methylene tetrahydromethanopterin reductase-like flavin-dependent oxidoreductase (luciferase family)